MKNPGLKDPACERGKIKEGLIVMPSRTFAAIASASLFVGCMLPGGCNTPSAAARQAATQPAESPQGLVYRMSDAQPLEKLETTEQDAEMLDRLGPPLTPTKLYFGEVRSRDDDTVLGPLIAMKAGGAWRALRLDAPGLKDFGWEYVGGGPVKNEVWGVLDCQDEDPAENLVLAHSIDGGATWLLSSIHKPAYYATFNDFAMARDGHGRVTIYLQGDYSPKIKTGYYNYRTTDDGKTWAAPDFDPDAMIPSDDVPEDEQPNSSKGIAKPALLRHGT